MKNDLRVSVNCHRCGGVMVYEKFFGSHENFWGWRCVCCGEIVEQVILENRRCTETRKRVLKEEEEEDQKRKSILPRG
jgi:hypothetical protein